MESRVLSAPQPKVRVYFSNVQMLQQDSFHPWTW